jgi:RNase P subunit RPR2
MSDKPLTCGWVNTFTEDDRMIQNECGLRAVKIYRYTCDSCDHFRVVAYCVDHSARIEDRIKAGRRVTCKHCGASKRRTSAVLLGSA